MPKVIAARDTWHACEQPSFVSGILLLRSDLFPFILYLLLLGYSPVLNSIAVKAPAIAQCKFYCNGSGIYGWDVQSRGGGRVELVETEASFTVHHAHISLHFYEEKNENKKWIPSSFLNNTPALYLKSNSI